MGVSIEKIWPDIATLLHKEQADTESANVSIFKTFARNIPIKFEGIYFRSLL